MPNKDQQARKWQVTINNPLEKGLDRERIRAELHKLKSLAYWCMADEIGTEEETPHTHIFIACSSPVRFSTLQKLFDCKAHLERCSGSAEQNRAYISKEGSTDFEEWGTLPASRGGGGMEAVIIDRIQDGANNAEILHEFPQFLRGLRDVEHVRQTLRAEEYRNRWRDLENVYIFGATGTGKTLYVMEGCGYSNVYAVDNYKHPFDGYAGENVILLDEFNGAGISLTELNQLLDGYPRRLRARYQDKQACYERVFIVSNLDLRQQYAVDQYQCPEIWAAFLRRIHKVICFLPDGSYREHDTQDYLHGVWRLDELPPDTPTPFDEQTTIENAHVVQPPRHSL